MEYLLLFIIVFLGVITADYVRGFIFALLKADRYEDKLAERIAKQVIDAINKDAK